MGWGGVGWGMLTFVWTCWGSWCYADDGVGWGGECLRSCELAEVLDATLMMGWGGVVWGMFTFVWTCWGSWCYADDGVGWGGVGHVNVRVNLLRFLMLRWWWGGVGHVNVRVNLLRFLMLRWWWGGNGVSSTRTKTWRKPRCPNCKRCKNDGADSWACLNLFEAKIAFRLGEIHIYLKNHQIQTSEFQSFCDRWMVFSPRRNDDFLKKTVFHDLTFRSTGIFMCVGQGFVSPDFGQLLWHIHIMSYIYIYITYYIHFIDITLV